MKSTVDLDQFMVRLPKGMRDLIKARAQVRKVSMNAEVVEILRLFFDEAAKPKVVIAEEAERITRQVLDMSDPAKFDHVVSNFRQGGGDPWLVERWARAYDSARIALEQWVPKWRRKRC